MSGVASTVLTRCGQTVSGCRSWPPMGRHRRESMKCASIGKLKAGFIRVFGFEIQRKIRNKRKSYKFSFVSFHFVCFLFSLHSCLTVHSGEKVWTEIRVDELSPDIC